MLLLLESSVAHIQGQPSDFTEQRNKSGQVGNAICRFGIQMSYGKLENSQSNQGNK